MQETVPLLVDLTVEGEMKESALLSTLRALTNLSTTERHHGQYTRMVQHLYNLMDAGSTPVKLQALKVLVNLSCSAEMVQHLLAAKVCSQSHICLCIKHKVTLYIMCIYLFVT